MHLVCSLRHFIKHSLETRCTAYPSSQIHKKTIALKLNVYHKNTVRYVLVIVYVESCHDYYSVFPRRCKLSNVSVLINTFISYYFKCASKRHPSVYITRIITYFLVSRLYTLNEVNKTCTCWRITSFVSILYFIMITVK